MQSVSKKECFLVESKNKIRTFWGGKPSKNKNIEQNFTGSYKKGVLCAIFNEIVKITVTFSTGGCKLCFL